MHKDQKVAKTEFTHKKILLKIGVMIKAHTMMMRIFRDLIERAAIGAAAAAWAWSVYAEKNFDTMTCPRDVETMETTEEARKREYTKMQYKVGRIKWT